MSKGVLIIYTGGTIGMIQDPETGSLKPFDFENIATAVPEISEFKFDIGHYTLPEIIDSSDINPESWKILCDVITEHYDNYSGFVILHGTDTMAYSASALSFMLQNLTKPIIFTGSQLPIGHIRTDGRENLLAAIQIAGAEENGKPLVSEVCIFFGNKLMRGNRTTKLNAERFDAFQSPNFPPLAEVGIHITYNKPLIRHVTPTGPITADYRCDRNIVILKLFPGIKNEIIASVMETKGLRGVILESYGSGNAPSNQEFLTIINKAIQRGIVIYNVTQCMGGCVEMGRYATSNAMLSIGVIGGYDITTEAAVCKLMCLAGRFENPEEIKKHLIYNLRGEIS
ncbi:MAG: asparaginase [Marinifilaceae bacterium]|nr:asparaginase [Marinifilaceae bacterium]